MARKTEKLLMATTRLALGDHRQASDVADILHKEGIGRGLAGVLTVRLNRGDLQPAVKRTFGESKRHGESASTPVVVAIDRISLQRPVDHLGNLVVPIGAGPA